MKCIAFLVFLVVSNFSFSATVEVANVRLYQPDEILSKRVKPASFSEFLKQVKNLTTAHFSSDESSKKSEGVLLVVVTEDEEKGFWLDQKKGSLDQNRIESFYEKLGKIEASDVLEGPVAIGFHLSINGGKVKPVENTEILLPDEIRKLISNRQGVFPDAFMDLLIPERQLKERVKSSGNGEIEELKPLGGKVFRPEGWFLRERHEGPSYSWIISKEDPDEGPYVTGLRIQTMQGIQEGINKRPQTFVEEFIAQKREGAQKVHRVFPLAESGMLSRVGVEVTEGEYRIIYSGFWRKDGGDFAIITTAGTTIELWDEHKSAFAKISQFELMGLMKDEVEVSTLPSAYMSFKPDDSEFDEKISNRYQDKYNVKNRMGVKDFEGLKILGGGLPKKAFNVDGERIYGEALIIYVVGIDGSAMDVEVMHTTDKRLKESIIEATKTWKFDPAKIGGKPVNFIAAQEFKFVADE